MASIIGRVPAETAAVPARRMHGQDRTGECPPAFKSIVRWLVYAGLVVFTTGAVMLGKADERLRLQVGDVVGPILKVLSEPADVLADGIAQVRRLDQSERGERSTA